MRKNILGAILVIVLIPGLTSLGFCGDGKPISKNKSSTKPTAVISKIEGKVTACNWRSSTVTISTGAKAPSILDVDKSTVISKGGKAVNMADIKIGDSVTVAYEIKENKKIAKSIILQSAPMFNITPEKKKR